MTDCKLCGASDGERRPGRLGRYALTCQRCEDRRGAHLVGTPNGYRPAST